MPTQANPTYATCAALLATFCVLLQACHALKHVPRALSLQLARDVMRRSARRPAEIPWRLAGKASGLGRAKGRGARNVMAKQVHAGFYFLTTPG